MAGMFFQIKNGKCMFMYVQNMWGVDHTLFDLWRWFTWDACAVICSSEHHTPRPFCFFVPTLSRSSHPHIVKWQCCFFWLQNFPCYRWDKCLILHVFSTYHYNPCGYILELHDTTETSGSFSCVFTCFHYTSSIHVDSFCNRFCHVSFLSLASSRTW